jgi:hypothetical protein
MRRLLAVIATLAGLTGPACAKFYPTDMDDAGNVEGTPEYDPDLDFGEPIEKPPEEEIVPEEELPPEELPDPGPPTEDPTDLDETMYPLGSTGEDAGTPPTGTGLVCSGNGWREFPEYVREFERRWPAVEREAMLYARCGDTTGNQRLETTLSALVAMYEATAHPRYATRFLKVVEALRAAAVRNRNAFLYKGIRERLVSSPIAGASCVGIEGGRSLCLQGCGTAPTNRRTVPLADMYLAEPVFRGLRLILATDACYLPAASGLRTRANRHWSFFRAVLYRRHRDRAMSAREGQFHILARYGAMGLQVCLKNPSAEPAACAIALQQGSYLRARMIAHPQRPGAVVWGSSTGSCDPRMPNFTCHTLGGACDGDRGEDRYDCRGPGEHPRSTCWQTRCGVTDVSHANTVVGFGVDLRRYASVIGTAGMFRDEDMQGLSTTLRDVIWCGQGAPVGPYAASVFIDGHNPCGQSAPPETPKRNQQRRALALGWFRLARTDRSLLAPVTAFAADLRNRTPTRDRTALVSHAEFLRAVVTSLIPEDDLLGARGCTRCPPM